MVNLNLTNFNNVNFNSISFNTANSNATNVNISNFNLANFSTANFMAVNSNIANANTTYSNITLKEAFGTPSMPGQDQVEYWYKFCILSIIIISVPLNIVVVAHTTRDSSRSRSTNNRLYLVASMGVSDILQAAIGYIFQYLAIVSYRMTHFFCKISSFSVTFFAMVSMNHITALAIDCYLFVCQPWLGNRYPSLPRKLRVLFCVVSWLYSLVWSLVPLIGWQGYSAVESGNCTIQWNPLQVYRRVYILLLFIFCFLIPVLAIVVCFTLIQITLYKMRKYAVERFGARSIAVRDNKKSERKYMTMSFVIALVYLVVWAPYALISIMTLAGYSLLDTPNRKMIKDVAGLLAKSSTIFNPFVYTIVRRRFRRTIQSHRLLKAVSQQKERILRMRAMCRVARDGQGYNVTQV